jgi:hypothetical protein
VRRLGVWGGVSGRNIERPTSEWEVI